MLPTLPVSVAPRQDPSRHQISLAINKLLRCGVLDEILAKVSNSEVNVLSNRLTSFLTKIYFKIEENRKIASLTGENFNVFRVLGLEAREVRTHSALLAELLNPRGAHGQEDLFLRLFIDQIPLSQPFATEATKVVSEYYLGRINADYTKGGYVDLRLDDGNQRIFIENKIYASDGTNQLLRYRNSDPSAFLIYLTLDGQEANTTLNLSDYLRLSYRTHVHNWLERCRKEAVTLPHIRETLTQYINLIEYLTAQTRQTRMIKEIKDEILGHPELAESIVESYQAFEALAEDAYRGFCEALDRGLVLEPIKLKNGNLIEVTTGQDAGGFWTGYKRSEPFDNATGLICRELIKVVCPDMSTGDDWFIGWHNPLGFQPRQKFQMLSPRQIIEFLREPMMLKVFVKRLVERETQIYNDFVEELSRAHLL